MMIKIVNQLLIVLVLLAFLVPPGPALELGEFGLRPQGQGFAFTGVADDLNSLIYNPAGLANLESRFDFGFYDIKNCEFAQKEGWVVSYGPLCYGQFLTREKNGILSRGYVYGSGMKIENWGQIGVAWKKFETPGAGDTSGVLDFGYLNKTFWPGLSVGVLAKNVFKDKNDSPMALRGGLAYDFDPTTTLVCDFETSLKNLRELSSYKLFYGMEVKSDENFYYRLGWSQKGLSAGLTWTWSLITMEYALIKLANEAETIHSLGFRFQAEDNKNIKEPGK